MSHIVTIKTEVRDPQAIRLACGRLNLAEPVHGTTRLYSSEASGWLVPLPRWRYPLVCQTDSGQLAYDNYQGAWGDAVELNRFLQAYAIEKTRLEARKQGYHVVEQPLENGSVKLTLQGGAV